MQPNAPQQTPQNNGHSHVRGSNLVGVRAHNERLVLTLIRQRGPLPKAEIARLSGLSAQTVSVIMRALEADGLLIKGDPQRGRVGQPSIPMALNPRGAFFFGLKVGRRSLELVLTDFLGDIQNRIQLTHKYPSPDSVVRFALDGIGQLLAQISPEEQARVAGLGIALPFNLWEWAAPLGVQPEDMADWQFRDIRAEIQDHCAFPVLLENDASAACGAELVFGTHKPAADFLYFFVAFFIGGGVVVDNTLFSGRSGNAGAVGSMPVPTPNDTQGQLVDVASLALLEDALNHHNRKGDAIWISAEQWNIPEGILSHWISQAARGLAYASVSAVSLMDVQDIVIDGWLPKDVRAQLVEAVAQEVRSLRLAGITAPKIHEGSIGSDARSLGAASLPLSERYLVDRQTLTNT